MSKKHFDDYYNKVFESYKRMDDIYQEYLRDCETSMVSPDRLKSVEDTLAPIKQSYETLRYIKYLLDMPNKKEKKKKYERQAAKAINNLNDSVKKEAVLEKNNESLQEAMTVLKGKKKKKG